MLQCTAALVPLDGPSQQTRDQSASNPTKRIDTERRDTECRDTECMDTECTDTERDGCDGMYSEGETSTHRLELGCRACGSLSTLEWQVRKFGEDKDLDEGVFVIQGAM